jgi:hypothetical protein
MPFAVFPAPTTSGVGFVRVIVIIFQNSVLEVKRL